MRKLQLLIALLLLLCSTKTLCAQEEGPYHLSFKRELLYAGSGLGLSLLGLEMHNRVPNLRLWELALPQVSAFDRTALKTASQTARNWSDYTLYAGAALPFIFLGPEKTRTDILEIGILYTEVMLINLGITDIFKSSIRRPRPALYADGLSPDFLIESGERGSFLSGHTSGTAASSFFFARVFADYFPESQLKPFVWGAAISLPALTGYLRVKAGRHFPTDVIAGYALGATIGSLIPILHRKPLKERSFSLTPSGNGVYLAWRF